jgi:hypothetical protein
LSGYVNILSYTAVIFILSFLCECTYAKFESLFDCIVLVNVNLETCVHGVRPWLVCSVKQH